MMGTAIIKKGDDDHHHDDDHENKISEGKFFQLSSLHCLISPSGRKRRLSSILSYFRFDCESSCSG